MVMNGTAFTRTPDQDQLDLTLALPQSTPSAHAHQIGLSISLIDQIPRVASPIVGECISCPIRLCAFVASHQLGQQEDIGAGRRKPGGRTEGVRERGHKIVEAVLGTIENGRVGQMGSERGCCCVAGLVGHQTGRSPPRLTPQMVGGHDCYAADDIEETVTTRYLGRSRSLMQSHANNGMADEPVRRAGATPRWDSAVT